jgi:glutathione S-transferase
MSETVTFWFNPMSRARIVRWMLEEIGRPYEAVLMEYGPPMKGADYLAVNPMGKVPAIRHGRALVTEAGAICAYLADAFPEAGLAPAPGDPARGAYYRWMFFAAGPVEAATTDRSLGLEVPEDRRGQVGYGSYDTMMAGLDHAVSETGYVAGERFSAADVYVGSHLAFGMMFGAIERRPHFERYVERVTSRPAAVRARAIDDALIAERKAAAPSA